MNIVVLTQTGGILKPFGIVLGFIMNYIYRFLNIFGISNIALTIILFTLVINVIMIPLTIKQQRFQKMSSIIQPEMKKIQKKYEGKKDERSMRMQQAETQALYDKYGASPTAGCLPMLIQLPVLFALYRVIYNVPAYVEPVKQVYMRIAEPIMAANGASTIMQNVISEMNLRVSGFDITNVNKVIDALYLVKTTGWEALSGSFSSAPEVVKAISEYAPQIVKMNAFVGGLNIADAPVNFSLGFPGIFPGILIPILAGITQYINIKVSQSNMDTGNDQMGSTMKMMNMSMPLMSVVFCFTLPLGLGLYWIASAVFRTLVFIIIDKFIGTGDIDKVIEKNKDKAAEKAEKRAEQNKKLEEYAQMKTNRKSISQIAGSQKGKQNAAEETSDNGNVTTEVDKKSLSGYAHMVKRK